MVTNELLNYLIETIMDKANESVCEWESDPNNEFCDGQVAAFYTVLDAIKSRLLVEDYDLGSCGLDVDLDERFVNGPARKIKNKRAS